ncbi:MAG: SCO family protein [Acidimicrobiales bacterium]|jgi:cytochrome oxidase Cu insertion factor (SCO1/SenC/PrrC family)
MTGMGGPPGPGDASILAEFHHALAVQGALVMALVAVLFVGWNQLRAMQYRRAVARGEPFGAPAPPVAPEPAARRFLRISFGLFWLFDGLLQLQSGMPLGLSTGVIQPSAAGSPGWVQHLVNSGLTVWTDHPAAAAASTVWIQVGIGVLLLVAPRVAWSRGAGLVSIGWGLIVWSFGNAFGGIFAPGVTFLFGAPGAIVFYIAAGGLVALPDTAWNGKRLGRVILGSVGALLVGFAVLQAWPGRGFWQGSVDGRPGTLVAMVNQMAQTSQPRFLSSLVSGFGSFDRSHGWGVNLFTVIAMAAVGCVLLAFSGSGRRVLHPTMVVLVVLCVADWVLIEDFGFWGGVGTDPNSMLPFLAVAVGGYLAVTRPSPAVEVRSGDLAAGSEGRGAPGVPPEPVAPTGRVPSDVTAGAEPVPVGVAAAAGAEVGADVSEDVGDVGWAVRKGTPPPDKRSWWEGIDTRIAARVAATVGAIGILLVGVAPLAVAATDRTADPQIAEATDGAPVVTVGPAPPFDLVDQTGAPVSLGDLRGYTVVLTFLDPVCTTDCPIIAQELRVTNTLLGGAAAKVRFVAVVANPIYRSVANVEAFDRQEGLDSQANWLFLTGSRSELESVWNAYGVTVESAPAGGMVAHEDVVYIIDSHGSIRSILDADPGPGDATSQSSFSGLVATQVTRVLHP